MQIRVLHVISSLKGYGAERQVLDLLPLLHNDEVTVGALAVYSSALSLQERERLNCVSIDVGRKKRQDYTFFPRLVREIRRFRPDIVHTHTHVGKYWGRLAAKAGGVPIVVHTEHNPCDPRRNVLERFMDRALHPLTNRVVTFLPEQKGMLAKIDGVAQRKIAIIPNGLAADGDASPASRLHGRRSLGVTDDQFAVLMIGRLAHQKNQQLALRALKEVSASLRERIRLFILGGGSQEPMLRALVAELGLGANVTFLGYRYDAQALLAGADLLLMTSLFEGMPLVLIEAMLAGVPILSTPWIGATEMLANGSCGFLSPAFESAAIANTLEHALRDEHGRASIALRAKERARTEFDIRRMADAYRNLYLDLWAARRPLLQAAAL